MSAARRIGTLVQVPEGRVHVRLDGPDHGRVVVLLHGFASSVRWWDRVVPMLEDRFRLVRIDLLGHGHSPKPPIGYHPRAQAQMVENVLAELDVKDVTVVGHSMGADIAIALAERSSRVERLVVVDEGPDYATATFPAGNELLTLPGLGSVVHRTAPGRAVLLGAAVAFAPGFRPDRELQERILIDNRTMPHACVRGALVHKKRYSTERGLDERLLDLGLPALVIFGEQDRLYDASESLRRYAAVPGVAVAALDGVGHSPMVEAPGRTAALIRDFVTD